MKNTIIIHNNWKVVTNILSKIEENQADICITTNLEKNILSLDKFELIIIDSSYSLEDKDIHTLTQLNVDIIFINNATQNIGKNFTESEILNLLNNQRAKVESQKTPTKSANIFRDFDSFKSSITQEVRRAKRYRYPFVVVMFELDNSKYHQEIIEYFSSKIREFDSLWIYDKNHFSMMLPHTGWNGAEILTNRLTSFITQEVGTEVSSLKNVIISFKRIEQDKDFILRVESALHGTYYAINNMVDVNIWKDELLSEFTDAKTIRVFNKYKGLLVSHDFDIFLSDDKLHLNNIRAIQLSIINNEKATYFHSKTLNKTIRAGVQTIDLDKSSVTLAQFEIIDSEFIKSTTTKLLIEEDMKVLISNQSNQFTAEIIEMSLDELSVEFKGNYSFEANIEFQLEFEINNSYKIKTDAKIISIEKGSDISYIEFYISTSINDNMKMSEFISQKQIQFIKELR